MAQDKDLPVGYDPELSRLYSLAETITGELTGPRPDWCELARITRDLTTRLEERCREGTARA